MFRRMGVELSRATMAGWMIRMATLTDPLLERMLLEIRRYAVVQCDETPFQVLKEDGKRATSESYLWALRGGPPEHPLLYYHYAPTRSGDVPAQLLEGFEGYLQTDGYIGYDALGKRPGIVPVGCFAHARRKFNDALKGLGKSTKKSKSNTKQTFARQGLARINALFEIERTYRDTSPEERHAIRQEKLAPKLDELRQWIDASRDRVPKDSLTGKAVWYLHRQWPKLKNVLLDGRLPIHTNDVERSIRPFAVGRRNWLFADTPKGAKASANLYSLVETAKANGLDPWTYLAHIFERLPTATTQEALEALLPWNIRLHDRASITS
jgi:transposase